MEIELDLDKQLAQAQAKIADAETNQGLADVRDAILNKANLLLKAKKIPQAQAAFKLALTKTIQIGKKMDINFSLLNISLSNRNLQEVTGYVNECKVLLEKGGDWQRKNKLKIYQGIMKLHVRDFKSASKLFFQAIPTFNTSEIITFNKLIEYAVITGVIELSRTELKSSILKSSQIMSSLQQMPLVKGFLLHFYKCQYKKFLVNLIPLIQHLRADPYFSQHIKFLVREIRVRLFNQFLQSYKTVNLKSMSQAFGVSQAFLDEELSELIAAKRINSRIDKVNGVIESESVDQRNGQYNQVLKQTDHLLNKIQRLSRIIDI